MAWQDYYWPDSDVLRNKFGIRDADELDAVEHAMAQARQVEIERGRVDIEQTLDAQHLRTCTAGCSRTSIRSPASTAPLAWLS